MHVPEVLSVNHLLNNSATNGGVLEACFSILFTPTCTLFMLGHSGNILITLCTFSNLHIWRNQKRYKTLVTPCFLLHDYMMQPWQMQFSAVSAAGQKRTARRIQLVENNCTGTADQHLSCLCHFISYTAVTASQTLRIRKSPSGAFLTGNNQECFSCLG
jgi:hypothetical protein